MKLELTTYDIAERLFADEYGGWSRAGALALAKWLEEWEESCGESRDLDVVAIRCEFSEHDDLQSWASDYGGLDYLNLDTTDETTPDELDDMIRDYIHDHGILVEFDGGIIVSSF